MPRSTGGGLVFGWFEQTGLGSFWHEWWRLSSEVGCQLLLLIYKNSVKLSWVSTQIATGVFYNTMKGCTNL
jgi:hypothetical protein